MALLQDITYQTIINNVKNYIKTNCMNIANYAGIPAQLKTGYYIKEQYAGAKDHWSYKEITCTKGINQVNASAVDTDMTNFINSIGINAVISQTIKNEEVYRLINNLASFCTSNVCFGTGIFNQSSKILFYQSINDFKTKENIINQSDLNLIEANDPISLFETLKKTVSEKARVFSCQYTINLT